LAACCQRPCPKRWIRQPDFLERRFELWLNPNSEGGDLPIFYKEFGPAGPDTTNSVFGNLNTKVFHNNDDPMTNEWAAKHFGMEIHARYTFNTAPAPQPRDFFDAIRQSIDPPDSCGKWYQWTSVFRAERFSEFKTEYKAVLADDSPEFKLLVPTNLPLHR